MHSDADKTDAIARAWEANARAWTKAIRGQTIASRTVTNPAIVDAVRAQNPKTVLDAGCGEGWLAGALAGEGFDVDGCDGAPELIAAAAAAHPAARFHAVGYEALAGDAAALPGPFDVIVCNFALFAEDLGPSLAAFRARLALAGTLIIQTLHPAGVPPPHEDGWREEGFTGFSDDAWAAMPWYYRTEPTWLKTLAQAGFRVRDTRTPAHSAESPPVSLILMAERASGASVPRK